MTTAVIVQARMTSTRLPGKVLLPLAGRPMLERLIERLRRVRRAELLVVATTVNATDDPIAALCRDLAVACCRGSEHDVLGRYALAARTYGVDVVVRVTADCPLLDPALVDDAIGEFATGRWDYVGNMLPPTWPFGMAVEVFAAATLAIADGEARAPDEREHVTPFIYRHPRRFRLHNIAGERDLSAHRWTVDTDADYALVSRLFETLYPARPHFDLADLLGTIDAHPEWAAINRHVRQKRVAGGV